MMPSSKDSFELVLRDIRVVEQQPSKRVVRQLGRHVTRRLGGQRLDGGTAPGVKKHPRHRTVVMLDIDHAAKTRRRALHDRHIQVFYPGLFAPGVRKKAEKYPPEIGYGPIYDEAGELFQIRTPRVRQYSAVDGIGVIRRSAERRREKKNTDHAAQPCLVQSGSGRSLHLNSCSTPSIF